jgi:hypothetical protein
MRKGGKKEKEKGFPRRWAGGDFWPSQVQCTRARAPAQLRPKARRRRGRGSDNVIAGPTRQRERREETAPRVDDAGKPVARGERNPAAGGLGGNSPLVARFLDNGEVP